MKIDSKLIERAKNGEQAAFTELYNLTYKSAYGVARQIVKSDDDACDLLQDAYVSAFSKLDTLSEPEKFQSWFNRIVSNKCFNYLKKKKPTLFTELVKVDDEGEETFPEFEAQGMEFRPDEAVDYQETKRLLKEIIDSLPEDQSLCVLMYYVQDMSVAEIAETLGVSQNTVKSRLNYGRKKIKTEVETLEKKGTKLYGITGLALIPFLRWMFANGATSAPSILSKVLSSADTVVTVADTVEKASIAIDAVDTVANVADKSDAVSTGVTVAKKIGKNLAIKIGAGVTAAAVTATGAATVATNANSVEVDDYIQEVIYCEGVDGYGSFADLDAVINIEELEKVLCGSEDDLNEYYEFCQTENVSIEDYIDVDVNMLQDGELSNGDVVEFKVKIDYNQINEMDGIEKKLKGDESYTFNCTVQGLTELVEVDIFSIFSSVGINTTVGMDCLELEFVNDLGQKDFGPCIVSWKEGSFGSYSYYIHYVDENGEKVEKNIYVRMDHPYGNEYIKGDKIKMSINYVGDGDFRESGFIIKPLEQEIEPDRVFYAMNDGKISDESFNVLKKNATEKAQREIAGGVTYAGAFVAVDMRHKTGGDLIITYKNNATGKVYAYKYTECIVDQNYNMLGPEKMSPTACEFYPDFFSISEYLDSYEMIKDYYSNENVLIFDINK